MAPPGGQETEWSVTEGRPRVRRSIKLMNRERTTGTGDCDGLEEPLVWIGPASGVTDRVESPVGCRTSRIEGVCPREILWDGHVSRWVGD